MNKKIIGLMVVAGILLSAGSVMAMPPHPDLEANKAGMLVIPNHNMEIKDAPSGVDFTKIQKSASGVRNFKLLVILVDFSDKLPQVQSTAFDKLMFDYNTADSASTVREFYRENSYGQLDLVTVNMPSALGWQRAPQTHAYYTNNSYGLGGYPNNTQKLAEDLVDLVDAKVNFADYDNDGNGYVDGVIIAHTGRGAEFSGSTADIWSHKWGITPRLRDGVRISAYSIQPEYWNAPGDMTIGVYAHEIGHLFGIPDLYDTDNSSRGVGRWSLMAGGSWNGTLGNSPAHFDAWSKARSSLGFVTPQVIQTASNISLPAVETTPTVYRINPTGFPTTQYFLLENRQKVGFDSQLPGSGLLVWHIDDSKTNNTKEWHPANTTQGNYWVALEQADGLWDMDRNVDQGDTGDPFPGSTNKTKFDDTTVPDSKSYAGANAGFSMSNISASGMNMTASVAFGSSAPVPDTTLPTTALIAPEANSVFVNQAMLSASASDNQGVNRVEFYLDGNNLIGSDNTAPYGLSWSTGGVSLGGHTLTSKAIDSAGNSKISNPVSVKKLVCGDVNGDNVPNVLDVSVLTNYINRGGAALNPEALADMNWDGIANILDLTILSNYVFAGGAEPANCSQLISPSQKIQIAQKATSPNSPSSPAKPVSGTAVAPSQSEILVGDTVRTLSFLRVRENPSLSAKTLKIVPPGVTATVIGGPVSANGYVWWNLDYGSVKGWSTGTYLEKVIVSAVDSSGSNSELAAMLAVIDSIKAQLVNILNQLDNSMR